MKKSVLSLVMGAAIVATIGMSSIEAEASIYAPDQEHEFFLLKEQEVEDADYSILFVGNSITMHPACDYWWGYWGMAASKPEYDYVHRVVAELNNTDKTVDYDVISFSLWERDNTRQIAISKLDKVLVKDYDLVIVQVGDNVHHVAHYKSDYETLVGYFKDKYPESKMLLIGDFWSRPGHDAIKKTVAAEQNCPYIDLSDIRDKAKYRSYLGAEVYGEDGNIHKVDFPPVTAHPNDLAYEVITERILAHIE